MKNLFIGFVFTLLDFYIPIEGSRIGLIPDFIGYIFMTKGLVEMSAESTQFIKVKPFAIGMAIYTFILYVFELLGIIFSKWYPTYIFLYIISNILSLYISYLVIMGMKEIEKTYNAKLKSDTLRAAWFIILVFTLVPYILWISGLSTICYISNDAAGLYFIINFYKSKTMYNKFVAQ